MNIHQSDFYKNPLFVGCMFVGIGIGMYFGETGAGTMVGMGVGFIFRGLYSKKGDEEDKEI